MRIIRTLALLLPIIGIGALCIYAAREYRTFVSSEMHPILLPTYKAPNSGPAFPVRLIIPSLAINAPILPVGVDAHGLMEVPTAPGDIAWYQPGATPGQDGNAVLAGHYDWTDGPAVLYRLAELETGDTIIVVDEKRQAWHFTVTVRNAYPADAFPTDAVFGPASSANINLITCDGVFDTARNAYTDRIVVSATLQTVRPEHTDKSTASDSSANAASAQRF